MAASKDSNQQQILQAAFDEGSQALTITGTVTTAAAVGGATEAKQDAQIVIETAIETAVESLDTKVTACDTGAVVVSSSALPTGASTEAKQDTGNTSLASIDTKVSDVATQTTLAALDAKVTAVNTGAVVVSSSALPTGAASETTLSSIDTKTPALGQAAMAASVPVTLASNQSSVPVLQQNALVPVAYDAIGVDTSGATTDVYEYYSGGLAGTLVATVTLTYSDSTTKLILTSVVRS